jgi:hypothetical protein
LVLRKIPAAGGPSVAVGRGLTGGVPRGASWGPDDRIVYVTNDGTGLRRVPAVGGEAEVLSVPDPAKGEVEYANPEVLRNGRAVLLTVLATDGPRIEALDLGTGEMRVLVQAGIQARYAASGHLIYWVQGALQAVAFDAERLEVTGDAVPVAQGIASNGSGSANYALSASGVVFYQTGGEATNLGTLVWVDRQGREEPLGAPLRAYLLPRLSPDGGRVAVAGTDQEQDVWIWDLARKTLTRLTFAAALDLWPVWTPDGRRLVFASQRDGS